jgi:PAS domain S-box-containing protein
MPVKSQPIVVNPAANQSESRMSTPSNAAADDVRPDGAPAAPLDAARTGRRARSQIIAITILGACVIGALWLIISMVVRREHDAAIAHARDETSNLTAAFQSEAEGKLDTITRTLEFLAGRLRVDPGFDVREWATANRALTQRTMRSVSFLAADGKVVSAGSEPNGTDLSARDYFQAHLGSGASALYISPLQIGRVSHTPRIVISRRVDTEDGHFIGVLVARMTPAQITALHKKATIGPRDTLTMIGFDGVVRARFGGGGGDIATAGQTVPLPPGPAVEGAPPQSFIRTAVIDGVTRLYSARALDHYPLWVVAAFDMDDVLAPPASDARLIEAIGAATTGALIILGLLLISAILRGVRREWQLADDQRRLDTEVRRGKEIQARLKASQERLSAFVHMGSDWLWEQDAEYRFTEIGIDAPNPSRAGNHLGHRRWEMSNTANDPDHWAAHRSIVEGHEPFRNFRYSVTTDDGTVHHVSVNGAPVHDENGTFIGYRGTGRNISAEVEAEAALREAKNRAEQAETLLRDAVDTVSEGFVIYDTDDRLVLCNDAYKRMYPATASLMVPGVTYETLVRTNVNSGRYPEASGHEEEWIAAFLHAHRVAETDIETEVADGNWVLVKDRRMRNGGIAGLRVDISALKQAKKALLDSEARLERAQEIAGIGSWEVDLATGRYVWSKEMYRIRGLTPETFEPRVDNTAPYVHPDDYAEMRRWLADLTAGLDREAREMRTIRPDGETRVMRAEGRAMRDADGVIRRVAGTLQDITERRLIERQLSQAQKMEAIGNLTGGLAHDFNNGLGVIIGNLDLLAQMVEENGTAVEVCDEAREAALRCADLIRGLLAFARRQPLRPRQNHVNTLVRDTARLLGRTLGEDIALNLTLSQDLWTAMADAAQLEAALVNLATNARDAMPKGGQLRIATRNAHLDADYAALHPEAAPGDHVLIEVSDTGTGIPREILGHIFEPFFTTKPVGQGTGLGLAMVFGFVKQSGGNIDVYSEPGLGTTFRMYLPRAQEIDADTGDDDDWQPAVGGEETVLLVEDNPKLRKVAARQLSQLGYRVLEAENAEAALHIVSDGDKIDLLFTDVVMPGSMDGYELARLVGRLRPRPEILLASGFPGGQVPGQSAGHPEFRLLSKPYNLDDLARAVRHALDSDRAETRMTVKEAV